MSKERRPHSRSKRLSAGGRSFGVVTHAKNPEGHFALGIARNLAHNQLVAV